MTGADFIGLDKWVEEQIQEGGKGHMGGGDSKRSTAPAPAPASNALAPAVLPCVKRTMKIR